MRKKYIIQLCHDNTTYYYERGRYTYTINKNNARGFYKLENATKLFEKMKTDTGRKELEIVLN